MGSSHGTIGRIKSSNDKSIILPKIPEGEIEDAINQSRPGSSWTDKEVNFLKKYAPKVQKKQLAQLFHKYVNTHRTYNAIDKKCAVLQIQYEG